TLFSSWRISNRKEKEDQSYAYLEMDAHRHNAGVAGCGGAAEVQWIAIEPDARRPSGCRTECPAGNNYRAKLGARPDCRCSNHHGPGCGSHHRTRTRLDVHAEGAHAARRNLSPKPQTRSSNGPRPQGRSLLSRAHGYGRHG